MADQSGAELEVLKVKMEVIKEIGFMGYRFLITLNSGAFIVLLTFLGNIDDSNAFVMDLRKLKLAMLCFLAAIVGTFVSMAIAYLSAQLDLIGKSLPGGRNPAWFVFWLLAPIAVSFLFFCLGALNAICGISTP